MYFLRNLLSSYHYDYTYTKNRKEIFINIYWFNYFEKYTTINTFIKDFKFIKYFGKLNTKNLENNMFSLVSCLPPYIFGL